MVNATPRKMKNGDDAPVFDWLSSASRSKSPKAKATKSDSLPRQLKKSLQETQKSLRKAHERLTEIKKTPAFLYVVVTLILVAAGFASSVDLITTGTRLPLLNILRGVSSRLPRSWNEHREVNARNFSLAFDDLHRNFCEGLQNKAMSDCLDLPIRDDARINCFRVLVENTCHAEFAGNPDEIKRCTRTSILPYQSGNFQGGAREVNNNLPERPLVNCHATLPTRKVAHTDIEAAVAAEKRINDNIDAQTQKTYDSDRLMFLKAPRFVNTILFFALFALPPSLVTSVVFSFELMLKIVYAQDWRYVFFMDAVPLAFATAFNIALVIVTGNHFTSIMYGGMFRDVIKAINRCVVYSNTAFFATNALVLLLTMNPWAIAGVLALSAVAFMTFDQIGLRIINATNNWKKVWNWLLEHDDITIHTDQQFRGRKFSLRVVRFLAHVVYAVILLLVFTTLCHCFQIDSQVIYDHVEKHNNYQRDAIYNYFDISWTQSFYNLLTRVNPKTVADIASA